LGLTFWASKRSGGWRAATPGLNEPRSGHGERITIEKQNPINFLRSCVLLDRRGYSFLIY